PYTTLFRSRRVPVLAKMAFSWLPTSEINRAKAEASPFHSIVTCNPQVALTFAPRALIASSAASTSATPASPLSLGLTNSHPLRDGVVGLMLLSFSAFHPVGSQGT